MTTESNAPVVPVRLQPGLTAKEQVRIALMAKGYRSLAHYAKRNGRHAQQVDFCLSGTREYPEIRDMIARDTGITREQLDALIADSVAVNEQRRAVG